MRITLFYARIVGANEVSMCAHDWMHVHEVSREEVQVFVFMYAHVRAYLCMSKRVWVWYAYVCGCKFMQ